MRTGPSVAGTQASEHVGAQPRSDDYPWLALAVFTPDLLANYGLVAYGGSLEEA
ncbi:MAG TPA: hypothetical protein VKG82_00110 [Solirubrobacteraceae bacterium]|nr:hypothetical protein [Solirubrobacteraceae bacterium]